MLPLLITIQTFFADTADRLKGEQKGATAVEYGLLIAVVAIAIVTAMSVLGGANGPIPTLISDINAKMNV
jgi:pilus assembly protein Flp/PilA